METHLQIHLINDFINKNIVNLKKSYKSYLGFDRYFLQKLAPCAKESFRLSKKIASFSQEVTKTQAKIAVDFSILPTSHR